MSDAVSHHSRRFHGPKGGPEAFPIAATPSPSFVGLVAHAERPPEDAGRGGLELIRPYALLLRRPGYGQNARHLPAARRLDQYLIE